MTRQRSARGGSVSDRAKCGQRKYARPLRSSWCFKNGKRGRDQEGLSAPWQRNIIPITRGGDSAAKKRFQKSAPLTTLWETRRSGRNSTRARSTPVEIRADSSPALMAFAADRFGRGEGPGDFHFAWQDVDAAEGGFQPEDILADILGGGGRRRRQARKGEDFSFALTIGFEEAARGSTRRIVLPDAREVDVRIPVGVRDGQHIRLKGQGGPGAKTDPPATSCSRSRSAPIPS